MLSKLKFIGLAAFLLASLTGCGNQYLVLNPKGPVAETQYNLIVLSAIICAIVVIPVLAILVYIVYRFRDTPDNKAPYTPNWDDSKILEFIWWGIPILIVTVLGYYTARDTYALTKPPTHSAEPITIQVTSLDWKWLFTYPDQKIATVNYVEIPAGVPVQFEVTSDAPMNSFWVPELGGQEYTMPGMAMKLWLQANKPGEYHGSGANFTGEGFAHMKFKVIAKPQDEFDKWVKQVKKDAPKLTDSGYENLTKQGLSKTLSYSSYPKGLFEKIVTKNGGHDMDEDEMCKVDTNSSKKSKQEDQKKNKMAEVSSGQ